MYELIKTRFSKAIKHYDNNAVAQKIIADKLFSLIGEVQTVNNILEIGCGTGNLSKNLLKFNPNKLILNDICPSYTTILQKKLGQEISIYPNNFKNYQVSFLCGNAQNIINDNSIYNNILGENIACKFNLIASSSTIQWMQNPLKFLIECKKIMAQNATVAISTFTKNNMHEIATIEGCSLTYNTLEEMRKTIEAEYSICHLSSDKIVLTFNEPIDVLRHIKLTGVNGIDTKPWTKQHLSHFTQQYNTLFRNPDGLCTLTYNPVYLIFKNSK
ncbi:MAG: malonyl-ACP O-methyltransferase BioC [Bacteroidales bacterium]